MRRKATALSIVLNQLTQKPQPIFSSIKALSLRLALRNDHWGARFVEVKDYDTYYIYNSKPLHRHFVKEDLPRIVYANPKLYVKVDRIPKTKEEEWEPEMQVEFVDGRKSTIYMGGKQSSEIMKQLGSLVEFTSLVQPSADANPTGSITPTT